MRATEVITNAEEADFVLRMLEDPKKAAILGKLGWDLQELREVCYKATSYATPPEILKMALAIDTWARSQGLDSYCIGPICSRDYAVELEESQKKSKRGK